VVLRVTKRLNLPPIPYLIALATSSNIGSAATIIGNPQNALIGVRSQIPFLPFAAGLWPVSAAGLAIDAVFLSWLYRREIGSERLVMPPPRQAQTVEAWMLFAGMACGIGMVTGLMWGARPAAAAMTAGAAVMLAGSRRPRQALREVDWMLLLFFAGLFVVMRGVEHAGLAHALVAGVAGPLGSGSAEVMARLAAGVTLLSQAVSNVPAVMLFVPSLESLAAETTRHLWLGLAAFSTLAGNLTIIGSVANVIVFESARREGVEVSFLDYIRAGFPLTILTLAVAWVWLSFA
jgi:Na+/H+ antiporter NhaD/arsenite permease-like protein